MSTIEDADQDDGDGEAVDEEDDAGQDADEVQDELVETHHYRGHCISHPGGVGQRVLVAEHNYNQVILCFTNNPHKQEKQTQ